MEIAPPKVEIVPIAQLKEWDRNPRQKHAVDAIAASIEGFGYLSPIIVQKGTYRILAGHGRVKALRKRNVLQVPVIVADLTDAQGDAYTIADNKLTDISKFVMDDVSSILKGMDRDLAKLTGFTDTEIANLTATIEAPEPQLDKAAELQKKWKTARGQIWDIGPHRLMCGDSASTEDVGGLMKRRRADLMATDPPYLVGYHGGNHPQSLSNSELTKDKHNADYKEQSEAQDEDFYEQFLSVAFNSALNENAAIYQWFAQLRQRFIEKAWKGVGILIHQSIIWVKSRPVLTHSHFMWQHEACFYGWKKGKQPERRPPANETTVWQIDSKGLEAIHPTEKPIELMAGPMRWHLLSGGLCYEPFSGSGCSLAAAEATGRVCNAMEISPPFVAVALERMADMGLTPKLAKR